MDDTTWFGRSKQDIEQILTIADEFYTINNIQVNKSKSVLLTNNKEVHKHNPPLPINIHFGSSTVNITPLKKGESTHMLGVWINLDCSNRFTTFQSKCD